MKYDQGCFVWILSWRICG